MSRPVFLPDDIVKHWPEVFKGIKVKAIPLEYLDAFHVTFSDGKKWIVECKQPDRPANLRLIVLELKITYKKRLESS